MCISRNFAIFCPPRLSDFFIFPKKFSVSKLKVHVPPLQKFAANILFVNGNWTSEVNRREIRYKLNWLCPFFVKINILKLKTVSIDIKYALISQPLNFQKTNPNITSLKPQIKMVKIKINRIILPIFQHYSNDTI